MTNWIVILPISKILSFSLCVALNTKLLLKKLISVSSCELLMLRAHRLKTLSQQTKMGQVGKSCPSWVIVGNNLCLSYIMFVAFLLTVVVGCGCEMLVLNVTKILANSPLSYFVVPEL